MSRILGVYAFGALLSLATTIEATAVTIGKSIPSAQRISFDKIDHAAWQTLLAKYCDRQGFVNYQVWKESATDQQSLNDYLRHLSHADPSLPASPSSKMAFWINAYNAVTIHGILREYPTSSIRNHTAKVFGYNIWDDLLLPVGDRTYSLNQMEHDVLRKLGDPRIHFAIVCASIGCPPLLNQAYVADQLDSQLTYNAKRFFADRQKFSYDVANRRLEVSPILKWFAEDFGNDQAAQMRRIAPFLPDQKSQTLAASGPSSVSYLDYDWDLNDQASQVRQGQ
jgi:hypothetical protein